jgi:hypothetical protein
MRKGIIIRSSERYQPEKYQITSLKTGKPLAKKYDSIYEAGIALREMMNPEEEE